MDEAHDNCYFKIYFYLNPLMKKLIKFVGISFIIIVFILACINIYDIAKDPYNNTLLPSRQTNPSWSSGK